MKLLSYGELKPKKGIPYSKAHLWRLENQGRFPMHVRIGAACNGWVESEIDEWIAERVTARDDRESVAA